MVGPLVARESLIVLVRAGLDFSCDVSIVFVSRVHAVFINLDVYVILHFGG